MPKNLIIMHLDTLDQLWFWQCQTQLRRIWRLKDKSMYFAKCYTEGAATVFALNSIHYGAISGLDHNANYVDSITVGATGRSFVNYLKAEHDYHAAFTLFTGKRLAYRENLIATAFPDYDLIISSDVASDWDETLESWIRSAPGKPFFLFMDGMCDPFHGWASLSFYREHISADIGDMAAAFYRIYDLMLEKIWAVLERNNLEKDTMIVVYSDHGAKVDKYLNSSPQRGRGITCDSSMVWISMFIHNSPLGAGVTDRLATLSDLPATLSGLLFPDAARYDSGLLFKGIDLTREQRSYVVSQNKFALQDTSVRGEETPKSYSITDGVFRLTVSDVKPEKRSGGMELYYEQLDPQNQNDLLEWFRLDGTGAILGFDRAVLRDSNLAYYGGLMNNIAGIDSFSRRYDFLRTTLREHVRMKERNALKTVDGSKNLLSEESFLLAASHWARDVDEGWLDVRQAVRELVAQKRPVMVFGNTRHAYKIIAVLEFYGVAVSGVLDNKTQDSEGIEDIPFFTPAEAAEKFDSVIVVSSLQTMTSDASARTQCEELGFEYVSYFQDILQVKLLKNR